MDITITTVTYRAMGGSWIFSYVRALLALELGDYGSAVHSLDIYVRLASPTRSPAPTLEDFFDSWHEVLKKLPLVTFRRKLKRVEIAFVSRHFNATDYESNESTKGRWQPTPERCSLAAGEIAEALRLLKRRIKRGDDFDVDRFLKDSGEILSRKIGTLDQLESILARAEWLEAETRAKKHPWELLDIDWSQYHRRARVILDDPFYWDSAEDSGPHGNDEGAKVLDDYRHWDKKHRSEPPFSFVQPLLSGCIGEFNIRIEDENDVRKVLEEQSGVSAEVCDSALIALPFAVIKMRASCPPDLIRLGLEALDRQEARIANTRTSEDIKSSWDEAISKMRAKLKTFAY